MNRLITVFACCTLFLSACDTASGYTVSSQSVEKEIIFFPDAEKKDEEISYYDAIIELRQKYAEDLQHMKIVTRNQNQQMKGRLKIDETPALIIIYQDEQIMNVRGKNTKEAIISSFDEALKKMKP